MDHRGSSLFPGLALVCAKLMIKRPDRPRLEKADWGIDALPPTS